MLCSRVAIFFIVDVWDMFLDVDVYPQFDWFMNWISTSESFMLIVNFDGNLELWW